MHKVFLKKGREGPVLRGHPWVFSGAIEKLEGELEAAGVADLFDSQEHWLARGLYNPRSQIRIRILTWEPEEIDENFFIQRIRRAAALREKLLGASTNAYRLVNGEGDFLPGLVVDRYGDFLVCQFFTAGIDCFKEAVLDALSHLFKARGISERSEGSVREEEGLAPAVGTLRGEEPPDHIEVEENELKFLVDVRKGQKTGFFLDQRDNRLLLSSIARDKTILNCFGYTGGFAAYALSGDAKRVISVESSRPALELAGRNLDLNGLSRTEEDLVKADAFSYLKGCQSEFDAVVVDPPSLAQ